MAEATVQNIWLNGVHTKMVHESVNKEGKPFYNVSFSCKASANGLGSVSVNAGQIRTATKRGTGEEQPDYKNVMLGKPGTKRQVSVQKDDGSFDRIEMTVDEILAAFKEGRAEYRKAHPQEAAVEEQLNEETAATKTTKKATKKSKKASK